MLHACVQRFDVTGNLKILAKFLASNQCHTIVHGGEAGGDRLVIPWAEMTKGSAMMT
jgi:hypothetical protein